MSRWWSVVSALLLVWGLLLGQPAVAVAASEYESGTYTLDYTVLKAENDSVSMANDYWEKPATVIVDQGKLTLRMTINHSQWVTEFKVPSGSSYSDVKVISTDEKSDKRLTEFTVSSLTEPLLSKIHVTVESIDYDHDYTIRFRFDLDTMKLVKAAAPAQAQESDKPEDTDAAAKPTVENKPSQQAAAPEQPVSGKAAVEKAAAPAPSQEANKPVDENAAVKPDAKTEERQPAVLSEQPTAEKLATDADKSEPSPAGGSGQSSTAQQGEAVEQENNEQKDRELATAEPESGQDGLEQPVVTQTAEAADKSEPSAAGTAMEAAAPVQETSSPASSRVPLLLLAGLLALSGALLVRKLARRAK